jgi:hypothetical protein
MKCILLILSVLCCSTAYAQFGSFSNPYGDGSTASIELAAGRSYSCALNDRSGQYELSKTILNPQGQSISAIYPEVNPKELSTRFSSAEAFGDTTLSDNIISFNTTAGAEGFGTYTITMKSTAEGSSRPSIFCRDTSRVCSFNTFVNDFNFLEVFNTGFSPAIVSYIATDFEGNTFSAVGTIAPGARADFDIHSQVGSQKFGSIVVRPLIGVPFNESIRARLSQYKGADLSFTEACQALPFNFIDRGLEGHGGGGS